jgi:Flp pilus assembly protein protease CpaA
MPTPAVLAHTVLVITAAVLLYAAWNDLQNYRIPNELIMVLGGLFVVHAILSGRWVEIHWNIAFAFLMFLIMLFFYIRKKMGGGDLKLLTVGFLWVGYACALPFTIFLLVFALVHAIIVKMGIVKAIGADGRRVPFAPTIAAALIGVFMLGCLEHASTGSNPIQGERSSGQVSPPQSR